VNLRGEKTPAKRHPLSDGFSPIRIRGPPPRARISRFAVRFFLYFDVESKRENVDLQDSEEMTKSPYMARVSEGRKKSWRLTARGLESPEAHPLIIYKKRRMFCVGRKFPTLSPLNGRHADLPRQLLMHGSWRLSATPTPDIELMLCR